MKVIIYINKIVNNNGQKKGLSLYVESRRY